MIDYHVHPSYSIDAHGTIDEFCRAAIENGIREIGFTTHLDTDAESGDAYVNLNGRRVDSRSEHWLEDYQSSVRQAHDRYHSRGLTVRLGLELDYYRGVDQMLPKGLNPSDFDFLIGSVHLIDHKAISLREHARQLFDIYSAEGLADVYFGLLVECIESGLCDVVGHLDIYRRFGEEFCGSRIHDLWRPHIEGLATAMKKHHVTFEVNISSWRKGLTEPMPEKNLIQALLERGVRSVTIGSDAHAPADVGAGMDKALSMLRSLGLKTITTYQLRRAVQVPIRQAQVSKS